MHRLLLALAVCLVFVPLLGVAPASDAPVVVVFPLQAPSSLDRETTGRIVTVLGNQIAQDGRVRVIPSDPEAQRADFLSTARKAGAQFYVTGYLTPLGDGASLIEQLVSVQSGTIVFSNSGQISNLGDVRAQGNLMRAAIVDRASRTWQLDTNAPPPQAATTTAPRSGTGSPAPGEANIGGLFHHKHATAAPSPAPSAAPAVVPGATATP